MNRMNRIAENSKKIQIFEFKYLEILNLPERTVVRSVAI